MEQAAIAELQDRFLRDMEAILAAAAASMRRRVVLLSGGTDSFLIVAVLRHLFPGQPLETVTIRGADTADADGADRVASYFGTAHTVRRVTVDELMANLDLVRGAGHRSLRKILSHICYHLALAGRGVAGADVYTGHAGDVLYGNKNGIYDGAEEIAAAENLPLDAVKTRIKAEHYARSQSAFRAGAKDEAGRHVATIVESLGAAVVLPYRDARLAYVSEIPHAIVRPGEKSFAKAALRRRYGLGDIVERQRAGMQAGTGLYVPFKSCIKDLFRGEGLSSAAMAERLSS